MSAHRALPFTLGLLLGALLNLPGFGAGLQAPSPPKPSGAVKVEDLANWKTRLDQANQALAANPKRAAELADALISEINKARAVRLLPSEQAQIYEQSLVLKARALHNQKDINGARRTLRQL